VIAALVQIGRQMKMHVALGGSPPSGGRFRTMDGTWILLGTAVVLLLARFVALGLTPFHKDEPGFLFAAAAQHATGHWAMESPLVGSSSIRYGPSILWLYGGLQVVLGQSAVVMIGAMCALTTAVQLFFALSLARVFAPAGPSASGLLTQVAHSADARRIAGSVLLLLSASPSQYLWSRLAWDQLSSVTAYLAVGALAAPAGVSWRRAAFAGVVLGFGVSSHPMILPLVVLAAAYVAALNWSRPRAALVTVGTFAVAVVVVNVPWLIALAQHLPSEVAMRMRHDAPVFPDRWLEVPLGLGSFGLPYTFDGEWPSVAATLPVPNDIVGTLGLLLCASAMGIGAVAGWRHLRGTPRRLTWLAVGGSVAFPVFMAALGTGLQPHYQFPTGWIVPLLLAAALHAGQRSTLRVLLIGGTVVCGALQVVTLTTVMAWVSAHDGTRGPHYGMTLGAQRAAVIGVCEASRGAVIENHTEVLDISLRYLVSTEAACRGRAITICPGATCPPSSADVERYEWRYLASTGARAAMRRQPAATGRATGQVSAASTKSGDINPPSDRPCASCTARASFTSSSADFVQGGRTRSEVPSGVTRSPHFTSREQ
jgi:hypothetical protein